MNVSNRKCVRTLARRSLRASRTRNLIAVLAIALTTVLFTSLFTIALSINDGFQQNNFRQVGGYSHGGFKYLTEAQYEALKDDPLIGQAGPAAVRGYADSGPFQQGPRGGELRRRQRRPLDVLRTGGGPPAQERPTRRPPTPIAGAAGRGAGAGGPVHPHL